MVYDSRNKREDYYPPILSNGEILLAPAATGDIDYTRKTHFSHIEMGYDGYVFRAGRRLTVNSLNSGMLLSFGKFSFSIGSSIEDFTQELDVERGRIYSVCDYQDGTVVHSDCTLCQDKNIYVLRKKFVGKPRIVEFRYNFCGYNEYTETAINVTAVEKDDFGASLDFLIRGVETYKGTVSVFCDKKSTVTVNGKEIIIQTNVEENGEAVFFFCLEDDLYGDNPKEKVKLWKDEALALNGVESLFAETESFFKDFYDSGYVKTTDEKINKIYKTALYNLKCATTKWSISIGIENASWHGIYFAFDEYHSFLALMSSGRDELAKRVPEFRIGSALSKAITRATHFRNPTHCENEQAYIPWTCDEYGNIWYSNGFWLDHIFQNASAVMSVYDYYEYSKDLYFLKRSYRMIKACSRYYTYHMIYKKCDGSYYVGKCTDLERLGCSVENPFLTACSVIKTLEVFVKVSEILGEDKEYAQECKQIIEGLRKNLPVENGRYVPYLGCNQKSIAVFGGKFPFDVMDSNDEKMLSAWIDYEKSETQAGNMYTTGKQICPWYALWKGVSYARAKNAEKTMFCLRQAHLSVGCFNEMFEINEPTVRCRPFFSTAAAMYVNTVNEMLLQSDGDSIYLLPAYDTKEEISFKLLAKGGVKVETVIFGNQIKSLHLYGREKGKALKVYLQGKLQGEFLVE